MARFIAQLIVAGAQTIGRAFTQALRQEYQATMAARQAAEAAGRDGAKAARNHAYSGMSLQEAKQILHVPNTEDVEAIQKRYEHLLKVNEKQSGGSFYLQSKVVRAKERMEMELGVDIEPAPGESDSQTDKPS